MGGVPQQFCIKLSMASISGRPLSVTLARFDDVDHPLIGASSGFFELCGLTHNDVIGKNCRFLNQEKPLPLRERLRHSVRTGVPFMGIIENTRYLGRGHYENFENLLHLVIVIVGTKRYILGIQANVTGLNIDLANGSEDAIQLQKMFDSVLSNGVNSWIHIQEGAFYAAPIYIYIRHDGTFASDGLDEVEIVEGDACYYRDNPPKMPGAADQYLVLAPRFPEPAEPQIPQWRFINLGSSNTPDPALRAPTIPGLQQGTAPTQQFANGNNMDNQDFQSGPRAQNNWYGRNSRCGTAASAVGNRNYTGNCFPGHGISHQGNGTGFDAGNCYMPQQNNCGGYSAMDAPMPGLRQPEGGFTTSPGTNTPPGESKPGILQTMKNQLQALDLEDEKACIVVRGITSFGLSSADVMRDYFSKYGLVRTVHVPYAYKKIRGKAKNTKSQIDDDKRPQRMAGRCFIVMGDKDEVKQILDEGEQHVVQGVMVSIQRFTIKDPQNREPEEEHC